MATENNKAIKRGRLPDIDVAGGFLVEHPDLSKYKNTKSLGGRPKKKAK
jgi:hypothetical protein